MLFITNRVLQQSSLSEVGRKIDFKLNDNNALQSVFYCRRDSAGDYHEVGSEAFLTELRDGKAEEMLIFSHGFANLPENLVFQRAATLQKLFDSRRKNWIQVVPIVWPCRSDAFDATQQTVQNYFTDQLAADASGMAYARVFSRLVEWQSDNMRDKAPPCFKRMHILAHSMGNRVLREAMQLWCEEVLRNSPPMLFRNIFLVAADIVNESLQSDQPGRYLTQAAANVNVYFASDDLALRASKVANISNAIASRRLGHTGPENWSLTPTNVTAIDCGDFNTEYDKPFGHTYFLTDPSGKPGKAFNHIADTIEKRVVAGRSFEEGRLVTQLPNAGRTSKK